MDNEVRKLYIALLSNRFQTYEVSAIQPVDHKVAVMRASEIGGTTTSTNANGDVFHINGDIYVTYTVYRVELSRLVNPGVAPDLGIKETKDVTLYPRAAAFREYFDGSKR